MSNLITSFEQLANHLNEIRDETVVSMNDDDFVCELLDTDIWQILVEVNSSLPAIHGPEVLFHSSSLWETRDGGLLEGGRMDATLTSSDTFIVVDATITVQGWSPSASESQAVEHFRYVLIALTTPSPGVQAHIFGTLDALLARAITEEEGIFIRAFSSDRSAMVVQAKFDEYLKHDITRDGVAIPRVDSSIRGAVSSLGRLLKVWSSRN